MQEHLILGLLQLIGQKVCWCGSDERLFEDLSSQATPYAAGSGDYPINLLGLYEYMARASWVLDKTDLDVLDYRELSSASLKYWREEVTYLPGASGWGSEAPILVCKRSRVPRVEYYWALSEILKYWDPFPLSILIFAEGDDAFGPSGRWIGPTFVLVNSLRRYYPTFDRVSYDLAALLYPPGVRGCLPDYRDIHEYRQLSEPGPTGDYSPFHERMLASVPLLREVGIRVRRVHRPDELRGENHTDLSRSEWIIEAPRWDNPDIL